MAFNAAIGKASVAIRATMDKLESDLSSAKGKVDGAVQKMARGAGKRFQQIGKIALGAIGGATAAVAGLAGALGKVAIDAAPVEGIAAAFEGLAESAGYGQSEMLAALQEGSSGMIAQRDLMLSFNKAAQLVSTDFASTLPDAMGYLSKVSASTGQDMGFLMDSLVTGVGRMSPMILDNLGIQVKLSEATERAAQMYGLQAEELSEAQKQAGLTAVVMDKLATNTASMPDVSESAAAKMAQLKAQIQDAKDQIGVGFLPVLAGLLDAFMPLIEMALPVAADLVERLSTRLAPVTEALAGFTQRLADGTDPLTAFKVLLMELLPPSLFARVMEIVSAIEQFVTQAREALAPVTAWLQENVKLQDILIVLGAAIASVVLPALWSIVTAVAPVIAVFVAAIAIVAALRAAWENDFLGIRTAVQTTVDKIKTWWAEHGEAIKATAQEIWDKVIAIFNYFKSDWSATFEAFRMAFQGNWVGFGLKLGEAWDEAWENIRKIGEETWDAIKAFFSETDWGAIGRAIIDGIASGISSAAGKIADAAKRAARAALDAAKGFLGIDSPSKVAAAEIGDPFGEGIGEGIERAIPGVVSAAQRATAAMMREPRQMVRSQDLSGGTVDRSREVNIHVAPHYYREEEPSLREELSQLAMLWSAS